MSLWSRLPGSLKFGAVAGLLPFIVNVSTYNRASGPGGVTCSYMDFAALIGGGVAILAAGAALMSSSGGDMEDSPSPAIRYGLGLAVLALGVVQILRGLGIIMGPCN